MLVLQFFKKEKEKRTRSLHLVEGSPPPFHVAPKLVLDVGRRKSMVAFRGPDLKVDWAFLPASHCLKLGHIGCSFWNVGVFGEGQSPQPRKNSRNVFGAKSWLC